MYKTSQALEQRISKAFQTMVAPTLGKSTSSALGTLGGTGSKMGLQTFNIGGKSWQLDPVLGQNLVKANSDMMREKGFGLSITSGFRSAEDQQRLINTIGGGKPIPGRVAGVGQSLHNYGGAVDIGNWQQAQPYLQRYGIYNPIKGDEVHFRLNNGLSESQMIANYKKMGWNY